jgi:uncharacterized protein YciI
MPPVPVMPPVRRTLFVERIEVVAKPDELERALGRGLARDELAFDKALVEAGKLILGGPFEEPLDGGLYVLRAASLAEAEEVARARPSVRAGVTRSTVKEWRVLYESPL